MEIQQVVAMTASAALMLLLAAGAAIVRRKNLHLWLPTYLRRRLARRAPVAGTRHVLFCFVDHFEPEWRRPPFEVSRARVQRWIEQYPRLVRGHLDADGRPPVHTFFFPEEEYRREYIEMLVRLCREGLGEIEVHLHHDRDTSDGLRRKLASFKQRLRAHDCLAYDARGSDRFAFIHGNWCLDNSRPDGRWCGVNDELQVLAECGCYADFTLPAAPDPAQTREINTIYYATDDPRKPKSHDRGTPVRVGGQAHGDLMLIQGVLTLNWRRRSKRIFPRIENSELSAGNPPTPERVNLWVREGVSVVGRPEWVFVKVHAHGAGEAEAEALLGPAVDAMFADLERRYNDGTSCRLHYVSAREMYNIARAAEDGRAGDPNAYRDYEIRRPAYGLRRDAASEAAPGGGVA